MQDDDGLKAIRGRQAVDLDIVAKEDAISSVGYDFDFGGDRNFPLFLSL